ncbi:MAG: LbtU family siderophore porin, partial [Deltaproteobacteria bacterium]|nr:LbtU family siderophore porin [Deltaproteobacteria bacterium]
LSAGFFNGDVNEVGEDGIHDFVAALNVKPSDNLSFGVSWISDLADSDAEITVAHREALIELAGGEGLALPAPLTGLSPTETGEVVDTVSGISAYVSLTGGAFTLDAEYLGATDNFDAADYDGDLDGTGDEPEAFNVELAYAASETLELAVRYEGNDDLFDLPEKQYGIAASYALFDNVSLAVEYLEGEYDNATDDKRKSATAQIAIEF